MNLTVVALLRQRKSMSRAVVTGGVMSPGEGDAVGTMAGRTIGAANGDEEAGGGIGARANSLVTLITTGAARPTTTTTMSR
jgi:hypothetical protein